MGLLQTGIRLRQLNGEIPTYCKRCDKPETSKFYDDGSYTKKCACGTTILHFHLADEHNKTSYFTKAFIPSSREDKDYKKKALPEHFGFKKQKNGVFTR